MIIQQIITIFNLSRMQTRSILMMLLFEIEIMFYREIELCMMISLMENRSFKILMMKLKSKNEQVYYILL